MAKKYIMLDPCRFCAGDRIVMITINNAPAVQCVQCKIIASRAGDSTDARSIIQLWGFTIVEEE